ncbi:3-hydroxyacyl-ACP dehydratase FabZ [Helicobacter bizzozeronii]|uniref:3-hydroxyacyl-ACP dehydratase FabZ n=1 Tax=Helicobacter bizzozeronii TaxID=56877 RepID=UPI002553CF38|nr:3-hydroxyacyl-ACP dehydratase FabZ [Helicobacter bizzozeronii]
MNIIEIQGYLENRYPFLMIDSVLDGEAGKFMVARKNLSINEWYFMGHFPDNPLMPGALQLEAMFNTSALCIMTMPNMKGKKSVISRISNATFHTEAMPGDILEVRADLLSYKRGLGQCKASIQCESRLISQVDLILAIPQDIIKPN